MDKPDTSPESLAIKALHTESPLRVWSLIVTVFGDIVMQQGTAREPAPIWNGALLPLLQLMQIEPGLVRTSLSRLVANGTLLRVKSGRNTYYELGPNSRSEFLQASERIYRNAAISRERMFELVILDRCLDRAQAKALLLAQGFRMMGPTVGLKVQDRDTLASELPQKAIQLLTQPSEVLAETARDLFRIDSLNAGYQRFLDHFPAITSGTRMSPASAAVTRVLLVHQFRRLILRDPLLPENALPLDWAGEAAQQRFQANLAFLNPLSNRWVVETGFLSGKAT